MLSARAAPGRSSATATSRSNLFFINLTALLLCVHAGMNLEGVFRISNPPSLVFRWLLLKQLACQFAVSRNPLTSVTYTDERRHTHLFAQTSAHRLGNFASACDLGIARKWKKRLANLCARSRTSRSRNSRGLLSYPT